jgi:hypothetical protein
MHRRVLLAFIAIGAFCFPRFGYAQFTDPRTYANTRADLNQLELDYAYANSNASLDTSLVISGAHLDLNQATAAYTRTFGILNSLAWIKASVPFASVSGHVSGTSLSGSVTGGADASLEIAALLVGAPALSAAEFETYQPTTTVGVSLTVTGPSGEYDPNKVVNLGSDRWSFKPQIGISYPFGPEQKWVADGNLYANFFTDNTAYHGREVLSQRPLPGLEAHISYNVTPDFWASLDTNYCFRGSTAVDGVGQNDAQKSLTVGAEASWAFNSRNSIALVFAKAVVHENAPAYTGVWLKYFYSWGRGYK